MSDLCRYFFKNRKEQRSFIKQLRHKEKGEFFRMVLDWAELCHVEPGSERSVEFGQKIADWIRNHSPVNKTLSKDTLNKIAMEFYGIKKKEDPKSDAITKKVVSAIKNAFVG